MKGIYKTHADYSHGGFLTEKAVAEQVRFLEFQAECKWEQNSKRLVNYSEESPLLSLWPVTAGKITYIKDYFRRVATILALKEEFKISASSH